MSSLILAFDIIQDDYGNDNNDKGDGDKVVIVHDYHVRNKEDKYDKFLNRIM